MERLRLRLTPFLLRAYPEPEPFYQKLAAWLGVERSSILLAGGADGALRAVFDTFVEPGQEVICAAPSYGMYPVYCGLAGADYQEVRFQEDLSLPIDRIVERIGPQTKLVLLAHPNQPVERLYSNEELGTLLKTCERFGVLLVLDEAYYPFCPDTALPLVRNHGNLVIVRSFSKAFGIAGLRLGYLVSRPENIVHLNKVRPMYESSSFTLAVGMFLLENDALMKNYVAETRRSIDLLLKGLHRLGLEASGQWTNSVLVRLPAAQSASAVRETLRKAGIGVRTETEPPLTNHLRITLGSEAQADNILNALEGILTQEKAVR